MLHRGWEAGGQPGPVLVGADLEATARNRAERGHELGSERFRQRAGVTHRLVVQRGREMVLQQRTDDGAADGGAELARGVQDAVRADIWGEMLRIATVVIGAKVIPMPAPATIAGPRKLIHVESGPAT